VAPHVPTPDVVRVSLYATLHGVPAETAVFFRRLTPPVDLPSMASLVARLGNQWNSFFRRLLGRDLLCGSLVADDLTPGSSLQATFNSWVGISPETVSVPSHIAISFRQLGPTVPRPWQWIVRWPGVPEGRITGNTFDPSWAAFLTTGIRDRYTLQGSFGWRWCVVQKVTSGVPLAVGVPYDVTNLALASLYASPMRRRLTIP